MGLHAVVLDFHQLVAAVQAEATALLHLRLVAVVVLEVTVVEEATVEV